MGDPFLNYFALFLLIFVVVVLFYGIIAIHDIPAKIAEYASSSPPGRDPRRWMGEPVHAARAVAVPLDLGDGVPSRARLGVSGASRRELVPNRRPTRASWRTCGGGSQRSKAA